MILTCYVVGNKVDDHFQPVAVCTLHQILKFPHASRYVVCQVGVYVIIILDGIWRACFSFHDGRMVGTYIMDSVIRLRGMLYDAGVPDMGGSKLLDFGQVPCW